MTNIQEALKITLGIDVANRRKELKMEQQDIEDYTGISIGTLSKLENGKGNITMDALASILEVLGMEISIQVKHKV